MFSQEHEVGVKCRVIRLFASRATCGPRRLVCGVIVQHHMQDVRGWAATFFRNAGTPGGGAWGSGIRGDLAGGHVQGGEQGGGPGALVVVGAALGQAGAQRQHRGGAVQGLHLGFLIHADPAAPSGGCRYGPPRRGSWLPAPGRSELECLAAVRLDLPVPPDLGHRRERDPQFGGQGPGRPVRDSQPGRRPPVIGQRGHDHVSLADLRWSAGPRLILQALDAALLVAVPPADHRRPRHPRRPGRSARSAPPLRRAARSGPASPAPTARSGAGPVRPAGPGRLHAGSVQELQTCSIVPRLTP